MTPPGGWRRALLVGAAVVAVAAVAVFANLALLDATGEERLGRLNQGDPALTGTTAPAAVAAPRPARTATRARTATAPPAATTVDTDDHSGSALRQPPGGVMPRRPPARVPVARPRMQSDAPGRPWASPPVAR